MKISTAISLFSLGLTLFSQEVFSFSPLTATRKKNSVSCKTCFPSMTRVPHLPLLVSKEPSVLFVSIGQNEELVPSQDDGPSPKPSPLVKLASSPLGAIAVLSCVVLCHELGHYLAARSFGVGVDEFSVGVGPKLIGFEAFGNPFNLRLLPLGGFVSLNKLALLSIPLSARIQILSAGVLFNLLLAFLVYTFQIVSGNGFSVTVFESGILVSGLNKLSKVSPAKGLLHTGDVIEAVNGKFFLPQPTSSELEVQRAEARSMEDLLPRLLGLHLVPRMVISFSIRDGVNVIVMNRWSSWPCRHGVWVVLWRGRQNP